jgi:hypothetical protein
VGVATGEIRSHSGSSRDILGATRTENTSSVSSYTRGCPHRAILTRLDIDGCSMSYPVFHIAHGGSIRPIDFAHGYRVVPTTLYKNVSID